MIELTNIVKRYQQHEVLRGVSLKVADGEVCVLLGPAARVHYCGQSTDWNPLIPDPFA